MQPKPPKPKKCKAKGCEQQFIPRSMLHTACCGACAHSIVRAKREQEEQRKRSDERKADRAKREALKTRSDWMKDAQREFNRYIRLRDAGKPCICCGLPLGLGEVGGAYDCGHYRSVGSAPHLRFDERNAHAQRKQCNRYGAGRAVDYRLGLIKRIGSEAVDELEAVQGAKKYLVDDLIAIRNEYRAKANALEKEAETA